MNALFGCPGRKSGLILRIGQCVFAAASMGIMISVSGVYSVSAFGCLIALMGFQAFWSFTLACLDVHALRVNKDLYNHRTIVVFFVIDWVTATLSLATTCSSAGVIVLYSRDTTTCSTDDKYEFACEMIQIAICFAFMAWSLLAITSYAMFFHIASF